MSWRTLKCGACCLGLLLAGSAAAQPIFSTTSWESPPCGGSALGDYDNDGWPDVFRLQCRGTQIALMHNEGNGVFALAEQTRSIQDALPLGKLLGYGQTFADYDNDGDLDLLVPVGMWDYAQRDRNVLLRNDRGLFTDVTLAAGLTDINNTDNVVWFDYDRDGYLDVYMGNPACNTPEQSVRNLLYRNKGNGTFEDATAQAGLDLDLGSGEVDGGCGGGTNGGMAGADFNDDGWPDLYIVVFRGPNWLFLNDGQGHFRNATTREIADTGQAFDVAVGDIDNDGDLDLFQAAGGLPQADRSLLLMNVGQGQFLDVTEGAGVYVVGNAEDTGFGDIDNDGDLDLTLGQPRRVWLNDGKGFFTDAAVQAVGASNLDLGGRIPVAFWDFDLDGHLDGQGYQTRLRNYGNTNHSLRVELVGIKSNRNGIGARVFATAGELRQMREILGGRGFNQDEMVAHFGLGERTKVDRLEVRWPSGQVDVLEDIPADQKIRVFEGREDYYVVKPSVWIKSFPDSLLAGTDLHLALAVQPAFFEPDAEITSVTADLSELGGPAAAPLQAKGDGTYSLEPLSLPISDPHGHRTLSVMIDQSTSLGPYWTQLSRRILVLPAADLLLLAEGLAPGWTAAAGNNVAMLELEQGGQIHTGKKAVELQITPGAAQKGWQLILQGPALGAIEGFAALGFVIQLGETPQATDAVFKVQINNSAVPFDLTPRLDLDRREWQEIQVSLSELGVRQPLTKLVLRGTLAGTIYLDDLRLVTATPPAITVVEEEHTTALPQSFSLSQNFPNPFNSSSVIRFALPERGEIELAVYNLAGQRVANLAEGVREAGNYTLRWDGRDDMRRELASGVYLYRLRAGAQVETRKLVLVR